MFPTVVRNSFSASEMGPLLCISHVVTIFVSLVTFSRLTLTAGRYAVPASAPSVVSVAWQLSIACVVDTRSFEPCCVWEEVCRVVLCPFFLMYFLSVGRLYTHSPSSVLHSAPFGARPGGLRYTRLFVSIHVCLVRALSLCCGSLVLIVFSPAKNFPRTTKRSLSVQRRLQARVPLRRFSPHHVFLIKRM